MLRFNIFEKLKVVIHRKSTFTSSLGMLIAAVVSSCSGGVCAPSGQTGAQYNLSLIAPYEYPAGVAVTIPMLVSNSGYSALSNLVYTVPSGTNQTGVGITITPGNCANLPAHSSACTIYANVPVGSKPGSFVVQANIASTGSTTSRIENKLGSLFSNKSNLSTDVISAKANLALTNVASNTQSGADGITLFYPSTAVVNNPDGTTTIIVTAVVSSSNAGNFNTITLVDANGTPISGVTSISGNSGSGHTNLAPGSIVALSVTLPKGSEQQAFYVQTQENGTNVSRSSNPSQINVPPANVATGIISIQPTYMNLSASYPKQVITLSNTGNGEVTNLDLSVLGGITKDSSTCGNTLAVGASCTYTVSFDAANPVSGTGSVTANYQATTTSSASQTSTVQYTGTDAVAGLQITSSSSNFNFAATTSSPLESVVITIANTGSHLESVTSITPPSPFTINTLGIANGCGSAPIQLSAGESCSYNLIYNNSTVTSSTNVPYVIDYQYKGATGIKGESSSVTLNYETVQSQASLSVSSSNINFPTIVNNNYASDTVSIVVQNQGDYPATNVAVNLTNVAPNFFSQTNDCPSSLPSGASCSILVKFGPVSGTPATSIESVNINYTLYAGGNSTTVSSEVTGQVLQAGSAVPTIDPNAVPESSGFIGGTGSQATPYAVQESNAPPTLTYIITNDSTTSESATGMYISESNLSPGWSLAPSNTCGTQATPISLEYGANCNLVLQLATTTVGSYPLDLSTVTAHWADEMNPSGGSSTSFSGVVNADVYQAASITISPTSATVLQGESTVITATLTGGYNVSDNTISLSPSPSTPDLQITSEPAPCVLNMDTTSCIFNISTSDGLAYGDYTLNIDNSGSVVMSSDIVTLHVDSTPLELYLNSPTSNVHPGESFIFSYSSSPASDSVVTLPQGFTTLNGLSSFSCNANPTCSESIISSQELTAGYYNFVVNTNGAVQSLSIPVSVIKNFAYIAASNSSGLQIELCNFNDAGFTNCLNSGFNIAVKPYGTAVSYTGLYAYVASGSGVYKCNISQTDKTLSGCVIQSSAGSLNARAVTLSSNGRFAYINSIDDDSVYKCDISSIDGSLTACSVGISELDFPVERLVLNFNGTALFVNTGSGNKSCAINKENGNISECADSGGPYGAGLGFNLSNTALYITNATSDVVYCQYNSTTNLLSDCQSATNGLSGFNTGVAFSTTYAYVSTTSEVYQCTIAPNGSFSSCSAASNSTITSAEGISILN